MKKLSLQFILLITLMPISIHSAGVKKFVFEERMIEGKIRRPQLIMIRAEQRPKFSSMIIKGPGNDLNLDIFLSSEIVEGDLYKKPFKVNNKKITNYKP